MIRCRQVNIASERMGCGASSAKAAQPTAPAKQSQQAQDSFARKDPSTSEANNNAKEGSVDQKDPSARKEVSAKSASEADNNPTQEDILSQSRALDKGWNGDSSSNSIHQSEYDATPLPPDSSLPHWERRELQDLLPPVQSQDRDKLMSSSGSRRLKSSAGRNKIVVYETKKLKGLKAEAKKRRNAEELDEERPVTRSGRAGATSSLPSREERKRLAELERSIKSLGLVPEESECLVVERDDDGLDELLKS